MATKYLCDRCGKDAGSGGSSSSATIALAMDGGLQLRGFVPTRVRSTYSESPDPDLCGACRLEALLLAAHELAVEELQLKDITTDAVRAPKPVMSPKTVLDVLRGLIAFDLTATILRDTDEYGASGIEALSMLPKGSTTDGEAMVLIGPLVDDEGDADGEEEVSR